MFDAKTIRRPSGDHAGLMLEPRSDVKRFGSEPSGRMIQISCSCVPDKRRVNAIHFPSGDHAGSLSDPMACEIGCAEVPSAFMT